MHEAKVPKKKQKNRPTLGTVTGDKKKMMERGRARKSDTDAGDLLGRWKGCEVENEARGGESG